MCRGDIAGVPTLHASKVQTRLSLDWKPQRYLPSATGPANTLQLAGFTGPYFSILTTRGRPCEHFEVSRLLRTGLISLSNDPATSLVYRGCGQSACSPSGMSVMRAGRSDVGHGVPRIVTVEPRVGEAEMIARAPRFQQTLSLALAPPGH